MRAFPTFALPGRPVAPSRPVLAVFWIIHCSGATLQTAALLLPAGIPHRAASIATFGGLTFLAGALVIVGLPLVMTEVARASRPWLAFVFGIGALASLAAALRHVGGMWLVPGAFVNPLSLAGLMILSLLAYVAFIELVSLSRARLAEDLDAQREVGTALTQAWAELVATDDALRRHVAECLHGNLQSHLVVAMIRLDRALAEWQSVADREVHLDAALAALAHVDDDSLGVLGLTQGVTSRDFREVVDELVARFRQVRDITWERGEQPLAVEPDAASAAGLMVLEAILNAHRHAGPCHIGVSAVRRDADWVEVRVRDDGRGFEVAQTDTGLGLAGLGAGLVGAGGAWHLASAPGQGTDVVIELRVEA